MGQQISWEPGFPLLFVFSSDCRKYSFAFLPASLGVQIPSEMPTPPNSINLFNINLSFVMTTCQYLFHNQNLSLKKFTLSFIYHNNYDCFI